MNHKDDREFKRFARKWGFIFAGIVYIFLLAGVLGILTSFIGKAPGSTHSVPYKASIFILEKEIYEQRGYYAPLINALQKAPKGATIKIVLRRSNGGDYPNEAKIIRAMRQSKAIVHTYIEGWAWSAGADIFLSGDVLHVPRKADIIIHLGDDGYNNINFNRDNIRFLSQFFGYLTPYQVEQLKAGVNIYLSEYELCPPHLQKAGKGTEELCVRPGLLAPKKF